MQGTNNAMTRWVLLACLLTAGTTLARAQGSCTFTDENGKTVTLKDCADPSDVKPAPATSGKAPAANSPNKFPFPGDTPAASPAPSTPPASNADKFPFPGEAAPPAAGAGSKAPDAGGLRDAGSSGSSSSGDADSSSSSSSSSSSGGGIPPPDDPSPLAGDNTPVPKKGRHKPVPVVVKQTPSEREQEDVSVAAFYENDGNFRAAYLRGKDAVTLSDDDPQAHLALAEAARKLGKFDEAQQNYKRCLELDPIPKDRKIAEKALKEMAGGA